MHTLSLVDKTFDINSTSEYYISIRISTNGFSFVVGDPLQKKVIVLYHKELFINNSEIFLDKLKSIYTEIEMIRLPYKKTRIFYSVSEKTVLIPKEIYSEEKADEIYNFQFGKNFNEKIIHSESTFFDNFIVFPISEPIFLFLKNKYPNTSITNDLSLTKISQDTEEQIFNISISRQSIEILAVEKGQIKYFNTFTYKNNNDILYYVIGAVRTFNKRPEIVFIDGYINKDSDLFKRLSSYFKHVRVLDKETTGQYSNLSIDNKDARFNKLYNSFSCE